MCKRILPKGDFGKAPKDNKKKKIIKKLVGVIEGSYSGCDTFRLPNNLEIMNKINEIIDIVNEL